MNNLEMDRQELPFQKLKADLSVILQDNILKYWIENTIDNENGGFVGYINFDNEKDKLASKGIVLNSRILWTFSKAYNQLQDKRYLSIADRAYHFISQKFRDYKNGGVFWELDFEGKPVNRRKQIYAQAFTIYALAEYYKVNQNEEVLSWAIELYELIEEHSYDSVVGGYLEALTEDWQSLEDVRLSEKDANEKKTMNTHLHVLEAYSNLISIWREEKLIRSQKKLINLFQDKFLKANGHLTLFFNEEWIAKGNTISFGHDIEAAWLLVEAAEAVGDNKLLEKTKQSAVKIASTLLNEGIDADGAIFNEQEGENGMFDFDKHWWVQAEGMVGLMNAYQLSEDIKYAISIFKLWSFINDKIIDHNNGEWYWKVSRKGLPCKDDEKVGFWKCPYHNSRACTEMINRINSIK